MKPTAKNYLLRRHQISTDALRRSLREHGQITPVYLLGGVVVDGRRRQRLLREDGRTPRAVHLRDHQEAARVLWITHPVAAWREYGEEEFETVEQAAEYFGVSPSDIAAIRRLLRTAARDGWRARYRMRWNSAQRYLSRVRQGTDALTLTGIETALQLPTYTTYK